MKKFNRFYLFVLLGFLLFPSLVNAATDANLVLDCTETEFTEKEEGVYCTVSLNIPADETQAFKTISFNISKDAVGDEAEFEAAKDEIKISGNFGDGFTIKKDKDATFTTSEPLMIIKNIKLPGTDAAKYENGGYYYNLKMTNVKLTDAKTTYSVGEDKSTLKIRLKSADATLKSISIDGNALNGFNPKALEYKFTTSNDSIKLSAATNNQNAKVAVNSDSIGVVKEIKNKKIDMDYGSSTIVLSVTAESGATKTYKIHMFRPYFLFPGYDFEFDSKTNTYNLNVSGSIEKFATCSYDPDNSKFVGKDNTLCMRLDVIQDVYGIEVSQSTYYQTLKLNNVNLAAEKASWSDKEIFNNMEIVTDADGNQTKYEILGELKEGENTLSFTIAKNFPTYTIKIKRSDSVKSDADKNKTDEGAAGKGSGGSSTSSSSNSTTNKNNSTSSTVKDETVESPKTGIVTYTLAILGLAGIAGGTYYYLRKKNIIKKI